jgi:lia operon protein LiaG
MKTAIRSLPTLRSEAARRMSLVGLAVLAALGILILGLLADASLLALTASADPMTERFVLRGARVEVSDLAGSVRVVPGPGTRTEVIVTRAGRDAARLRVLQDEVAGTSRLRVSFPGRTLVYPGRSRFGRTTLTVDKDGCLSTAHGLGRNRVTIAGGGPGPQAWAEVEVRVPRGQRTVVRLGVGEAEARDVDGDLTLDVASASVTAGGTSGRLLVDTGSGSVVLHTHRGDLTVDTGSGDVDLTNVSGGLLNVDTGSGSVTGEGVRADDLVADTGSGEVRIEDLRARSIRVDTGSGGVSLDLTDAPASLLVDTGSGDVTISGPPDLAATVELETGSGEIEIGYPVVRMKQEHGYLRGTIGDGRSGIQVDTGSGSVRLSSR